MALSNFRGRKGKPFEVVRIQYGAWDNPGVSLFATLQQEPMPNMIKRMRRSPDDATKDRADCDLVQMCTASPITKNIFQTVKYQVEQIAAERNSKLNLFAEEQRENEALATALEHERNLQVVKQSRHKQLHDNSHELRELDMEILRAHTAIQVKNQMQSLRSMQEDQRGKDVAEGREERERVLEELRLERESLRKKAEVYRQQLIEQIKERRQRYRSQQEADVEEGRQKRFYDETQLAAALKQEAERKVYNRLALKKSQEDFEAMQTTIKLAKRKVDVLEPPVLEALSQTTKCYLAQALQRRADIIDMRAIKSQQLACQLSEIKYAKDSREELITGLLVSEHKAKEDEKAHRSLVERRNKRFIVREEQLSQREEQQFYRQKAEAFNKLLPYDETCFAERQNRQYDTYATTMSALSKSVYNDMAAMIVSNAQRRAEEAAAERDFRQHLLDLQSQHDKAISEERMRMLHREPEEVVQSLRTNMLTDAEIKAFNLKGVGMKPPL